MQTKQTNEEIIEELQRRIITLSSSLEEMAMENLELDNKLRSATGKPSTNLAAKASPVRRSDTSQAELTPFISPRHCPCHGVQAMKSDWKPCST